MTKISKSQVYRDIIDDLVKMCHQGQGQISAYKVREGVWNSNATPEAIAAQEDSDVLPPEVDAEFRKMLTDDYKVNLLLNRLSSDDREILAKMLTQEIVAGVFETLKTLEQFKISPFEEGYEGSPFNDFIGRLGDWEWPES